MVALPSDLLPAPCPPASPFVAVSPDPCPSAAELDHVVEALSRAERPVAIVGGGAVDLHGPLTELAEHFGLGVYTGFRRQDAFPNSHRNYVGHLTLGTSAEVLRELREADLVLVLGCRLSEITSQAYTLPATGTRVIQVDRNPGSLGAVVPTERAIVATVPNFVRAVLARGRVPGTEARDVTAGHLAYMALSEPAESAGNGALHPTQVMAAMRRHLPADSIITNDAGNFSVFGHRFWRFEHPRTQVAPTSGAMGYAVPAAIGAQLAAPGRPVVALVGDGGFLMSGMEIETAARLQLPVLVVVFQNGLYGTIAMHQARHIGRLSAVDIGDVDIAGFSRALGADAATIDSTDELDDAFTWAKAFDGPRVLVVRTDPDVLTPTTSLSGLLAENAR